MICILVWTVRVISTVKKSTTVKVIGVDFISTHNQLNDKHVDYLTEGLN